MAAKSSLTRKQREIQARDRLILDVARRIVLEDGYHGLTMDRIATGACANVGRAGGT